MRWCVKKYLSANATSHSPSCRFRSSCASGMNASKIEELIASLSSATCRSVQTLRASSGVGSFFSSNDDPVLLLERR